MQIDKELLYVMTSSGIGDGEVDLGTKLTEGFFKILTEVNSRPAKIIFMNSGIFLTTEGSPVLDHLLLLEEQGTEIASCKTCLNYFHRMDQLLVGVAGDMRGTVESLTRHKRVVTF